MTETTLPLSRLRFGDDYPGGSINARKTKSEEGLPELLASILANGLIYPLIGRHSGTKFYVAEGNRRLAALRLGVAQKRVEKNFVVRIEALPDAADPLELSLTANIMRLPMHEVDQYEAFVGLRDAGREVGEIASRFGTSDLVVRRRLALGSLSPKLRQAWREESIDADDAKAFTVVEDHELQDRVYTSLAQGQMLNRYSILRALTNSDATAMAEFRFVGEATYLDAGGRLSKDLFEDEAHVLSPEVLKRLARDKVDAAIADLLADGWAWAALGQELPHDRYRWDRVKPTIAHTEEELFRLEELKPLVDELDCRTQEQYRAREAARQEQERIVRAARLRSFTAEEKRGAGCVLTIRNDGALSVDHGLMRPGSDLGGPLPAQTAARTHEAAAGDADDAPATSAEAPEISGALAQTVSEWQTIAAANALADEPDLALRVLLAALCCYGSPARFSRQGWHGLHEKLKDKPKPLRDGFAQVFKEMLTASLPHLRAGLAIEVARSLDLTAAAAQHPAYAVKGAMPLVDALDAEGYLKAARQAFEADVYFDRAPAAVALAAIEEMGGPRPSSKKKGVIALAASDLAKALGWLPPGLRSSAYAPPRATAPAAATGEGSARGRYGAPAGAPATA